MSAPIRSSWVPLGPAGSDPGFDGYLALPPSGQGPGLLLWQEIFGVNDHIRAVADQYALAGFTVLAPDVFWRSTPRAALGYASADIERGRALMGQLQPDLLDADLRSAAAALRARPEATGPRLGAIGYCLGGRLAYFCARLGLVDAAVAYYGGGIHDHLEGAAGIAAALQFHYAGNDGHIPPEAVERVRGATARAGNAVHVYPGTMHGFNCWERGSHHPAAAALALGRSLGFLAEHLFETAPAAPESGR
jgi:carboxymethylenebutenolidase